MDVEVGSLPEFKVEAERFLSTLAADPQGATLVTLSGELGAGKTAFTKAAAEALGVEETVTSPTFVLEKIYLLPPGKSFKRLVHIDAYRLDSGTDLAPLGFDEIIKDSGNIVFLEWPEHVADALPTPAARVSFTVLSDGSRRISYA